MVGAAAVNRGVACVASPSFASASLYPVPVVDVPAPYAKPADDRKDCSGDPEIICGTASAWAIPILGSVILATRFWFGSVC